MDRRAEDEVIQEHDHKPKSFKRSPLLIAKLVDLALANTGKKLKSFCILRRLATLLEDHDDMGAFFCAPQNSFQVADAGDDDDDDNVYCCHVDYANDDLPKGNWQRADKSLSIKLVNNRELLKICNKPNCLKLN